MRILITGGSGFIGSHLVNRLLNVIEFPEVEAVYATTRSHTDRTLSPWQLPIEKTNQRLFNVVIDLEAEHQVKYLMQRIKFDVIFHLAANPIVKLNEGNHIAITKSNVLVTQHLLSNAAKGTRFVFSSSATVYGNKVEWLTPMESEHPRPSSVYGATKAASEALVTAYSELGLVSGINLRLVANVGTNTTHGIFHDIIRKLKSKNKELELFGSRPGSIKQYVHVRDTVSAFVMAAFDEEWKNFQNHNVNICYNYSQYPTVLSVEDFADTVMEYTGIQKPIKWLGNDSVWRGDNKVVKVSGQLANSLGWKPTQPNSKLAVAQACIDVLEQENVHLIKNQIEA